MKKLILILCCFISMSLCGQAPTFEWAIQTEGPRGETGSAITTDKSGNIYVTGIFSDTVDFDPSSNIFNLTSTATTTGFSRDIFIAKYNTNGAFIWAFSLGSTEWDWGLQQILLKMYILLVGLKEQSTLIQGQVFTLCQARLTLMDSYSN